MKRLISLILLCPLTLMGMNEQPAFLVQPDTASLKVQIRLEICKTNNENRALAESNEMLPYRSYRSQRWVSNQPNAINRENDYAILNNIGGTEYKPVIDSVILNSDNRALTITYHTLINNESSAPQVQTLRLNDSFIHDINDDIYVELTTTLL